MKRLPVRPRFLLAVSFALLIAAPVLGRPNVVLIMTDDQGYGDFGATGNRVIETPHLDAMAKRSAWMRTFYVSPVCSPTRASLMTGRYNYRTRAIDTYLGRSMMDTEEVTIAEVLRGAGYATGIFGKWHLGDTYPMRPRDQGFEETLVHKGGGLAQPSEPLENERRYTDPILFHNGQQVRTEGYCTDVYFDAALEFIEEARKADRSFFAYIATNAPHSPYHDVPEDLRSHYMEEPEKLASLIVGDPRNRAKEVDRLARIAAMITNIDWNVGRLFDKLRELELTRDTIVAFLVDNGPNTRRYVGPFRGKKTEVREGGIRSPFWIQWPARLEAGVERDEPAAHIDVMPTLLEACGVEPPEDVRLDGRSFLGVLTGEEPEWPERTIAIQTHRGDRPVRYHHFMIRGPRWKLLHPSGFGREGFEGEPRFELYDVVADPGETRDLAAERPAVVSRLKSAYDRWFDDVSSTRPDNYAPPRIWVGSEHEDPTVLTRQDWRRGTWARDSIGHWKLHVARPGRYHIRLIFRPEDHSETAALRVGGVEKEATVEAGARSASFEDVELAEGDTELHATLAHEDERRGVYQVEVSRRGEVTAP